MIFAETVEVDGGVVAIVLAVLLLLVLIGIALVVLACKCATRAARGSRLALVVWLTISAAEFYAGVIALGDTQIRLLLATLLLIAFQASFYVRARSK